MDRFIIEQFLGTVPARQSLLGEFAKYIDDQFSLNSYVHLLLKVCVSPKVRCLYCSMKVHIYRGTVYPNPSLSSLRRHGRSDHNG
jgi:hypothetical protein